MDDSFDFDFDDKPKVTTNKPKENDDIFGDEDFDFDFDKQDKPKQKSPAKKNNIINDDPFGDDFDLTPKTNNVINNKPSSMPKNNNIKTTESDDPFADSMDFDNEKKPTVNSNKKADQLKNNLNNLKQDKKKNSSDFDDEDDTPVIRGGLNPQGKTELPKPEYVKQVSPQINKQSVNNPVVPVKQVNTVPSSQVESEQEEDYGFDSEPEEDKNNTIQNNNNKMGNQPLNTNESKAMFSDQEEDHFEKTMETSMNNLNEIKDKSKTGQQDKIVHDQISEQSDDDVSKGNRSQARSKKLLHDKSDISIDSNKLNSFGNKNNNNNKINTQHTIESEDEENFNPNPLSPNKSVDKPSSSFKKSGLTDGTAKYKNIDNYSSKHDHKDSEIPSLSHIQQSVTKVEKVATVDTQKRHNNVQQLKETKKDPKSKHVESNFQESIEELSPIRKSDKSLEKSHDKSNMKESPNPKDFNLREKHEEKLRKLREEKEKSRDNINKSSSEAKMNNIKSRDRLNTKESEKSVDKILLIKQKHQNRKDFEDKIREENQQKIKNQQEKKLSNIGKLDPHSNKNSKIDLMKNYNEKVRDQHLDKENYDNDIRMKDYEQLAKQNNILKKEIQDLKDRKTMIDHQIQKYDKQIEKQNYNANNRAKLNQKDVEKVKKQISALEEDHLRQQKKIDLLSNPESRHNLAEELRTLDSRIIELARDEKELKDNISKNEIKFQRAEKNKKVNDKNAVQNEYTTISKDQTDKLEQQHKLTKQIEKSLTLMDDQAIQIDKLKAVANVVQLHVDDKEEVSRYKLYVKLKREQEVLNHKNISDSKKFERDFTTIVHAKTQLLSGVKEIEESVKFLDDDIEEMLDTLFKLVKGCVQRNIPPSTLVKECNLNIDEAALHKSAFELAGRMQDMDFSLITNDKISADGEIVEIPQLKDNKQKVKAINHVIEESKNHTRDSNKSNADKNKERLESGKAKKQDKKHVNIDKPNKVPELSIDNSRITIEPGMNDGKSFHTEIETDRDNDHDTAHHNQSNNNNKQGTSQTGNKEINISLPRKEEGEPAFKLELNDLKAIQQKGSVENLHTTKEKEVVYKPEMNRVPSRQGKKAVRREDPYAKQDPFANDNNDPFLTNGKGDDDDPFASGGKTKADPFASDIGGGLALGNNRKSVESLNVRKSKVSDPFGNDDLDLDDVPFAGNVVSKPAVVDLYNQRQVKSKDPFAPTPDPFGESIDPFATKAKPDPFSNKINKPNKDPFADTDTESNHDPFATNRDLKKNDPFAVNNNNDPFGSAKKKDPFANDPFATSNDPFGDDPFI